MSESGSPELCPIDSFVMDRDYRAEQTGFRNTPGNWPMVCWAAGGNPEDIPAMRKVDAEHGVPTDYTSDGDPILISPAHKKKYLRAHGLYDRNASYSDAAPVNR